MELLLQSITIEQYGLLVLFASLAITYMMIPRLIGVIKYKWFIDYPNKRSSHSNKTPNLGGITFYVSFIIGLILIQFYTVANVSFNLIAAVTILFIAGLKDDLVLISVRSKLLAQLLAITLLLVNSDIPLENFYGYLGLSEVPARLLVGVSYFAMLSIINAYNFIDGIDGLAAMLGIAIFAVFGVVFYSLELHFYFLLALAPLGYLLAFLRYNVSKSHKIFMGDTGSMITGFLIAVLSLRFLSLNLTQLDTLHIQPENVLLLTMGILFVMTIDTLRVVVIRLLHKKAFFKPDRNHVHHMLIDAGLSHRLASLILTGYGMLTSSLFYLVNLYLPALSLWLVFGVTMLFTIALLFQLDQKYRASKKERITNPKMPAKVQIARTILERAAIHIFRIFF